MYYAGVRHYHRGVVEILVEILDYPAAHGLAVEALRHVDALDFRELRELVRALCALRAAQSFEHVGYERLAVAYEEGVDEGRERLRRQSAGPSREYQRAVLAAQLRTERDSSEVEYRQYVRVRELVLKREADRVEIAQAALAFERPYRRAGLAHRALHVGPRRVDALGVGVRYRLRKSVQNLEAEVAHADLVEVRECVADTHLRVLLDGAASPLPADVARRALDRREQLAQPRLVCYSLHIKFPPKAKNLLFRLRSVRAAPLCARSARGRARCISRAASCRRS